MLETIVLSFAVGSLFGAVVISWIARVQMEKKSAEALDWKHEYDGMAGRYQVAFSEYWKLRNKLSADPNFKLPLMATTYAFSTTEDRDNFASGLTKPTGPSPQ